MALTHLLLETIAPRLAFFRHAGGDTHFPHIAEHNKAVHLGSAHCKHDQAPPCIPSLLVAGSTDTSLWTHYAAGERQYCGNSFPTACVRTTGWRLTC